MSWQIPDELSAIRVDYIISLRDLFPSDLPLALSAQDLDCSYQPGTAGSLSGSVSVVESSCAARTISPVDTNTISNMQIALLIQKVR